MKKRAAVFLLAVLLAVTVCPPVQADPVAAVSPPAQADPAVTSPFADLPTGHWSFPYVYDLYTEGVVGGYPDGTFQGENQVTWGETFKLILLAIGCEEPEEDLEHHWAWPYIEPALDERLVWSFDDAALDEVPTRQQVARMTARALDLTDIAGDSPYADCTDGYVVELFEKGIMEGTVEEDGLRWFYPDQPITREEMAAIVWRMTRVPYTEGMTRYNNYWLDTLDAVPLTPFTEDQFETDEQGRVSYSGGYFAHGVDVSGHKRDIDWEAVAADGIDFAIVRAGNRLYGKNSTAAVCEDSYFHQNMQGAIDAGLDVGAYFFSAAVTVEEAIEEADKLLEMLEPYREHVTYPVVCDWEFLGGKLSRAYGVDAQVITQCVDAFCRRVEEAGYQPMFYFNEYCGYVKLDLSRLTRYPFWYAEYGDAPSCIYGFQMWQYSSKGTVAGINSTVDMDLCFVPYPQPADPSAQGTDPLPQATDPLDPAAPSPEPVVPPTKEPTPLEEDESGQDGPTPEETPHISV